MKNRGISLLTKESEFYKQGLKFELGIDTKRNFKQALKIYRDGAESNDVYCINKVKYAHISILHVMINIVIMIVFGVFGWMTNRSWMFFLTSGVSLSITTMIDHHKYWIKTGYAYISNLLVLYLSLVVIIPLSAIIPYMNGLSWIPITILFGIGFFGLAAGVILFISSKNRFNFSVILSGVWILIVSLIAMNIDTPDKIYAFIETTDGIEITDIRIEQEDLVIPKYINNQLVVSIGESALSSTNAKTITIPDNIKVIKDYALSNNPYLTSVVLPEGVMLGNGVFYNDTHLQELKLPDSMVIIPNYMCFNCISLKSIDIPASVTHIGSYAFMNSGLEVIDIPYGVETIGNYSFANVANITQVAIPDSVTTVGNYSFSGLSSLVDIELSNQMTRIPEGMLSYSMMRTFEIPSYIHEIGAYAFAYSTFEQITTHDAITFIGKGAFRDNNLTSIYIPNTLTRLEDELYMNNPYLASIHIPESVQVIGSKVFMNNTSLEEVSLPSHLLSINTSAFENNISLKSIDLPDSLATLGSKVFAGNINLLAIILPENITVISSGLFDNNISLESIIIKGDVTSIGDEAFQNNESLKSFTMPSTLVSIGDMAFKNNYMLEVVHFNEGLLSIGGYAFQNASKLEEAILPQSLISLGDGAFSQNHLLTTVELYDQLFFVGHYAFFDCPLLTIKLSDNAQTENWATTWNPGNRPIIIIE